MTFVYPPPSPPDVEEIRKAMQGRGVTLLPLDTSALTYRDALRVYHCLQRVDVTDSEAILGAICAEFNCSPATADSILRELADASSATRKEF